MLLYIQFLYISYYYFTVVDDGIAVVEPDDVRLGETNHLARQTDGERHLNATISRPHRELRRHHRRVVVTQTIQLPCFFHFKKKIAQYNI